MLNPLSASLILSNFNQLQRCGVKYGYGAKADEKATNPRSNGHLSTSPNTIDQIDCSGYVRYALCIGGGWSIPDGSQNQCAWCEKSGMLKITFYAMVNFDIDHDALYICFIKSNTNGCGPIGHVWLVSKQAGLAPAETLESHGGGGIDSRRWDTVALTKEFFEGFVLPINN